jgi:hypothetical protein
MHSIFFGLALVAGRNRVPRPAAGKTALVIFSFKCRHESLIYIFLWGLLLHDDLIGVVQFSSLDNGRYRENQCT